LPNSTPIPYPTAPQAHHHLEVTTSLGALRLHLSVSLHAPWTILFGPSGSGKSSILRAACGLLPGAAVTFAHASSTGWVELNEAHHSVPTHTRNLAYAPQGAAVFPHLTVLQNIAFPQNVNRPVEPGTSRDLHPDAHHLIPEALDLFRLTSLAHRLPRDLSGGELQRVALARAFCVPQPSLALLDEPFTGLDRPLRGDLLPRLQQRLAARGIPVLSVTHDVEEALLLRADVIRLTSGRVTAQGPATEVLTEERTQILQALQTDS
jgi:molybdate transport system ATP-binding protein